MSTVRNTRSGSLAKGEINRYPSLTLPDQSMSIAEIVTRFVRGQPLPAAAGAYYAGEDDDTPNLDAMELTDAMDYMEASKNFIKDTDKKLRTPKKSKTQTNDKNATNDNDAPPIS